MHTSRFAFTAALTCVLSLPAAAQAPAPQMKLSRDEIKNLATVQAAILIVLDSVDRELSAQKNKKDEQQAELREKMRTKVGDVLKKNSLSDSAFQRRRFLVSTDQESRKLFDSTLAVLTGQALPGTVKAAAAGPVIPVPATAAGMHIGHVVNSFGDTPDKAGLLPTALAEQKIAATHAGLAMRNPMNLDMLKLHAGHILHAIDPTLIAAQAPGKGYGVKKAATGIATHIELAATATGATPNEITHSKHIATSARATVARADQIIALVQKIQTSTDAAAAAQLMSQVVILCDQLDKGADANSDGRITWDAPEGGLQQVQEHITLMLAAPKPL